MLIYKITKTTNATNRQKHLKIKYLLVSINGQSVNLSSSLMYDKNLRNLVCACIPHCFLNALGYVVVTKQRTSICDL